MEKSTLVKRQFKTQSKHIKANGPYEYDFIKVTVRYDDRCGNGHNTFSITGETTCHGREDMGGCIHEEIAKHFPELAPLVKWHLVSTDGPLHYLANTLYHADEHGPNKAWCKGVIIENGVESSYCKYGSLSEMEEIAIKCDGLRVELDLKTAKEANLEHARGSAIWPDATLEQLRNKEALEARLPGLMEAFRTDIESLGFVW